MCQLSASASSFELLPSPHLSQGQFQWLILCLGQGQDCTTMLYDLLRVCCLIFLPLFFKPSEKLLQMISDDSVFLFPPLTTEEVAHSSLLIPSDVQLAKGCSLRCEAGCTAWRQTHTCLKCKQTRLQVQTCERGTSLVFWGIFTDHYGNIVQTCCNRMAFFIPYAVFYLWQTLLKVISLHLCIILAHTNIYKDYSSNWSRLYTIIVFFEKNK